MDWINLAQGRDKWQTSGIWISNLWRRELFRGIVCWFVSQYCLYRNAGCLQLPGGAVHLARFTRSVGLQRETAPYLLPKPQMLTAQCADTNCCVLQAPGRSRRPNYCAERRNRSPVSIRGSKLQAEWRDVNNMRVLTGGLAVALNALKPQWSLYVPPI